MFHMKYLKRSFKKADSQLTTSDITKLKDGVELSLLILMQRFQAFILQRLDNSKLFFVSDFNTFLFCQILGVLDGRNHSFDGEESSQVCRVWGDDDESEEPPNPANDSSWSRFRVKARTLEQKISYYQKLISYFSCQVNCSQSKASVFNAQLYRVC